MEQITTGCNQPEKQKKYILTDKFDIIMLIFLIIATFSALYIFLFNSDSAFSYKHTVIYLLSFTLSTIYITKKKRTFNKKSVPLLIGCVLLSIPLSLHSDVALGSITVLLLIFMTLAYFTILTNANNHSLSSFLFLSDILHTSVFTSIINLFLPYVSIHRTAKTIKSKNKQINKTAVFAILGLLAGIIALCIIIPVLISSDAMFENTFNNIFGTFTDKISKWFNNIIDNIILIIICLYATMWVFPFLYSALFSFRSGEAQIHNRNKIEFYHKIRTVPVIFFNILLSITGTAYLFYIFTQIAYFFSAFTGKLPADSEYSLSEYARRGFFEMIVIALFNFGLIALTVLFAKRKNGKITGYLKFADIFLSVFTILTSAISVSKILLYIDKYGLTYRRVSVVAVNIVIIVTFISIIIKLFVSKFPYMKIIISTICTVIFVLGIFGIDNIVTKYNYNLYKNNTSAEFDAECFANYNGLEYLIEFAKNGNEDAQNSLSDYYNYSLLYEIEENKKSDTIDQYKAKKIIIKNKSYLETFTVNDLYMLY